MKTEKIINHVIEMAAKLIYDKNQHIEINICNDGTWGVDVVYPDGRIPSLPDAETPYDALLEAIKYITEGKK